jgi:hypothetical protein
MDGWRIAGVVALVWIGASVALAYAWSKGWIGVEPRDRPPR